MAAWDRVERAHKDLASEATAGRNRAHANMVDAHEINKALTSPDVKELLFKQGLEVKTSTPAEFGAYMKSEFDKWARVIKEAGISAN